MRCAAPSVAPALYGEGETDDASGIFRSLGAYQFGLELVRATPAVIGSRRWPLFSALSAVLAVPSVMVGGASVYPVRPRAHCGAFDRALWQEAVRRGHTLTGEQYIDLLWREHRVGSRAIGSDLKNRPLSIGEWREQFAAFGDAYELPLCARLPLAGGVGFGVCRTRAQANDCSERLLVGLTECRGGFRSPVERAERIAAAGARWYPQSADESAAARLWRAHGLRRSPDRAWRPAWLRLARP